MGVRETEDTENKQGPMLFVYYYTYAYITDFNEDRGLMTLVTPRFSPTALGELTSL